MDVFEAITNRKSIRTYKDTPVPKKRFKGFWKPGAWRVGSNRQEWKFVLVRDAEKENNSRRRQTGRRISRLLLR